MTTTIHDAESGRFGSVDPKENPMSVEKVEQDLSLSQDAVGGRGTTASPPERPAPYRGYHIYFDPPPIPIRSCDWHFYHDDYGGPGDPRHGDAASEAACRDEIDMIEDDQ